MLLFRYFLVSLACILSGCTSNRLSVQTEYLSHESLASYYVNTPDPCQYCPNIGQRLIISWCLPKSYLSYENLYLAITVRFHNHQEDKKQIPIRYKTGTYLYEVLNESFFENKGILTYKVDLLGDREVLEQWRHPLWTEWIKFEDPEEQSSFEDQQ